MSGTTVCVVGAGNMGSGIAQACAQGGCTVHLVDQDMAIVERAKARMQDGLAGLVKRGRYTEDEVTEILDRVQTFDDVAKAAAGAEIVIEAVFESYEVKTPLFATLDAATQPETILATNTSSLSVTKLAAATKHPERVVGLHFFFPAMINKLVEVVKGDATSERVFDRMMAFSREIGKVPIQTLDRPGFCVNRFFVPLMNEACRLLAEGHGNIPTIDAAHNKLLGTGMGPFQLMNVTGVPISLHAQRTLHEELGPFYKPADLLVKQVEELKADWDLEGELQESEFEYIEERFLAVAVGIAAQLVEEGVASLEDTEKGATVGLRWAQGPFTLANNRTTHKTLSAASALYMRHGDDFPIAQSLRSLGSEDRPFPVRTVSLTKDGHIGFITVERPAQLNALNTKVIADLDSALTEFVNDDSLRVAILSGEGKAFVAGADLKELHEAEGDAARAFTELGQKVFRRIETIDKPVLAAINGFALGGGLELALACDLIYASDRAELGLPETGLGIIPGFGGTQRLARRAGPSKARELIYTGRRLDGTAAAALGVVDGVFPASELNAQVVKIANSIARQAPLAIAYSKRAIRDGMDRPSADGLELEQELAISTFGTDDQEEGFNAFLARRKPVFQGR